MMRFFRGIRTMEEAHGRYRELVVLLHPDRNAAPNATEQFQAMQEEYRDMPVLLKYASCFNQPQAVYIPVPVPHKTNFWDVLKTIANAIPPEGYIEGVKMVVDVVDMISAKEEL